MEMGFCFEEYDAEMGTNVGPIDGVLIRSAKQDDNYGASNIILPCPSR
jgi:hypothetical protein